MARKHKHPEHVNHERWLVSYADFITLLFATFTALYALSKADASKAKAVADGLREAFGTGGAQVVHMEALEVNGIPSDQSRLPDGRGQREFQGTAFHQGSGKGGVRRDQEASGRIPDDQRACSTRWPSISRNAAWW